MHNGHHTGAKNNNYKHGLYAHHFVGNRLQTYLALSRGDITAQQAAYEVHALAQAHLDELIERSKTEPDIVDAKAIQHAKTEYRLAARNLWEAENAARGDAHDDDETKPIEVRFTVGRPTTRRGGDDG